MQCILSVFCVVYKTNFGIEKKQWMWKCMGVYGRHLTEINRHIFNIAQCLSL